MLNIFRRKNKSVTNKPIKGSFDNGTITLTNHNGVIVFKGDIHGFNIYLRRHKIPRSCVLWGEYDSIKESFWKSRYN